MIKLLRVVQPLSSKEFGFKDNRTEEESINSERVFVFFIPSLKLIIIIITVIPAVAVDSVLQMQMNCLLVS